MSIIKSVEPSALEANVYRGDTGLSADTCAACCEKGLAASAVLANQEVQGPELSL